MALFFSISLGVSATGLVLLLVLKRHELRTGRMFLARMRPQRGGVAHSGVMFVEHVLPSLVVSSIKQFFVATRLAARAALARGILLFEHVLQRMLLFVRDMTQPPQGGGPASAFLREVAEHKRKLLEQKLDKRAIFDE